MRDCKRALFVLLIVVVLFSTLWMNHDSTIGNNNFARKSKISIHWGPLKNKPLLL
jgi:hypothetical protein